MIRHVDILRAGLRIAMTTIRKMQTKQKVDADALLRRLAVMRAEAKEVRDAIRPQKWNSRLNRGNPPRLRLMFCALLSGVLQ